MELQNILTIALTKHTNILTFFQILESFIKPTVYRDFHALKNVGIV
jgi:hypothetical protein